MVSPLSALRPEDKYNLLDFSRRGDIPYLKADGLRADSLYVLPYRCWKLSEEDIAKNWRLPLGVVRQAIQWCTENDDLITRVLAEERRSAGLKD